MPTAKKSDMVRVHYKGTLKDGSIFDSSHERDPLEFTIGEGMVIPGFDDAIMGMNEGETKTVSIPPEDAYGPYRDDLVVSLERSKVPPDIDPQVGMKLKVNTSEGRTADVVVTDVNEDTITIDGNHPLAGKELVFEIKLLEIL